MLSIPPDLSRRAARAWSLTPYQPSHARGRVLTSHPSPEPIGDVPVDAGKYLLSVILASGTPATLAAKAATTTIPIVFSSGIDPVALGLVASLNRPGANLTGIANLGTELGPKQLQLLRELVPGAAAFGVLVDPAFPDSKSAIANLHAAAHALGLQLIVANAQTDSELQMAFATLSQWRVGAMLVSNSAFFSRRMEQLATLAATHSLPAILPYREYALAGSLMSYGSSIANVFWQAGVYAARILKGEKPADLPVQRATKFELVINTKTAKALGLTSPKRFWPLPTR